LIFVIIINIDYVSIICYCVEFNRLNVPRSGCRSVLFIVRDILAKAQYLRGWLGNNPVSGTANTGGGAGGCSTGYQTPAAGGSGAIIVRYTKASVGG